MTNGLQYLNRINIAISTVKCVVDFVSKLISGMVDPIELVLKIK